MLEEGRRRDAAANAVLGAAFALSAAQSPQSLVKSGHIEAPGVAGMQRLMDPRKKRKDLDLQRVSHSARNKTFKEFVEEAYLIEAKGQPTFSSREDLEAHYGGVPKGMVANNAASKENPKWRLVSAENRKEQARRRKERLVAVTGKLTDKQIIQSKTKERLAAERGKELHHATSTEESDKIRRSMSPSDWEQRKQDDAKKGVYHGHHPRNLVLANPTHEPTSSPGLHHSDYHAFERRNRGRLADVSNAISTQDAYRILNNKRKRQQKR
jgi:hypothetical protein